MAPTAISLLHELGKRSATVVEELQKRQFYYNNRCSGNYYWNGYRCIKRSGWSLWGRWVVAGVLIFVFVLALCIFSRLNARRRRKQGLKPIYGTGWVAPAPKYSNNQNAYQQPPPPQYPGPNDANYNNNNGAGYNNGQQQYGGYYGNETQGVSQPQNTYYPPQGARGGDDVYAPPPGPPPGK